MSTGRGGGGAPRRFLLEDQELEERESEGVVGELLGSLPGLTILPAADPSFASYGWITGGSPRTPAALAPLHPRSAFSVSSGLTTDVPSLRSAPALGARGWVGGGWHPFVDVNAIGKSKKFQLVWVKKSEGLFFRNVGEHQFCRAVECKIRKHQGSQANKFDMGCDSGWFIASKSQALSDKVAAFKTLFLEAAKITKQHLIRAAKDHDAKDNCRMGNVHYGSQCGVGGVCRKVPFACGRRAVIRGGVRGRRLF